MVPERAHWTRRAHGKLPRCQGCAVDSLGSIPFQALRHILRDLKNRTTFKLKKKKNTDTKLRDSTHPCDFLPLHFQGIQKVSFKSLHSLPRAMLTAKEEMCGQQRLLVLYYVYNKLSQAWT